METNAEKLVRLAPKLTEREKKQINARFQAYIFRRSKTGEVWTTCCGVHKRLDSAATDWEHALLTAPHTPAPVCGGKDKNAPNSLARVECPWCGARAAVKEIQYTGQRKNLWEFRRVLTLRQWRGALWACAYACTKDYGCVERSTEGPDITLLGIYRFRPGKAECAERNYGWYSNGPIQHYHCQTAPGKGKNLWTTERPFGWCNEYGLGYETIGMEEIGKSAFRYCGVEKVGLSDEVTRTLTACCFYPRQIEFLMKCGMKSAVRDLVANGKKNAAAIHWNAETPAEFLGVKPRELRMLQEANAYSWERRIEALGSYRRQKGKSTLEDCLLFAQIQMDGNKQKMLLKRMREHGVSIGRLLRYMNKHCLKKRTIRSAMDAYVDYLVAAEGVGLDLNNPIFLMPRDFEEKHDQVTAAWSAVLAERRRKAEAERRAAVAEERKKQLERFRGRVKSLARRYTYTDGELLVRPAVNAEEIVREGKLLHHCVGGYADRHISGATTILFLRRRSAPGKPLCTIEMNGNNIRQIHGWDDERTVCEDNPNRENPRKIYAAFLDEWQRWLGSGSKRDKAGRPIIRKKKARKAA